MVMFRALFFLANILCVGTFLQWDCENEVEVDRGRNSESQKTGFSKV